MNTKKVLGGILYVSLLYVAILYLRPVYFDFLLQKFSKITYIDDMSFDRTGVYNMQMAIFCLLSFFSNYKILQVIGKKSTFSLTLSWTIDLLFAPLSVLIMILYNNFKVVTLNVSKIENVYLMWLLLALKNLIILMVENKLFPKRKVA